MDRVGAFGGAAYVLLINGAQAASLGTGNDVQGELDWLRSGSPAVRIGLAAAFLSYAALMVFVGYLYARTREAGWPAVAAIIAGTATVVMSLAAASTTLAIVGLRDVISVRTAVVLSLIEAGAFVLQVFASGLFVLFAAWAALETRVLGRTLSYAGIAIGGIAALAVALTAADISIDYFAWPFLLVMLWVVVISLRLGFARGHLPVSAPLPRAATT
jgi:hypothetical protein